MDVSTGAGGTWALRVAEPADVDVIAELRAAVMRPDLERLGRFDARRVRQRLRDSFSVRYTSVVVVDGAFAGCVTLRPGGDGDGGDGDGTGGQWLEHFYLEPRFQGRGLGSAVLCALLDRVDAERVTVRLNVLRGSAAQRLYRRHGFTVETQDPVDVFMVRPPINTEEPHV
ncbi:GNAT family N-acetyltransferase [Streptomyces sp. NBC_00564]|uniref:GNAT family N-acetyltransferase n=1 Tax=Streptomyces sp. NBC_00564 TaxID=2903663 RepID=UPI00352E356D|nr:GNAT family N-acetyltransferase [Streptomyces sp. NBC_00564]